MPSARSECPTCSSAEIVELCHLVRSSGFEYFRCRSCNCCWMVRLDAETVATRVFLGDLGVAASRATESRAQRQPVPHRICDKCEGRADLLESLSIAPRVDYYRCSQCLHVWIQDIDPNVPRTDVTIRADDKAS